MKNRIMAGVRASLRCAGVSLAVPAPAHAQSKGNVVEEIVARVNNQIITLSDYQKAAAGLAAGSRTGLPELLSAANPGREVERRQKNLLARHD